MKMLLKLVGLSIVIVIALIFSLNVGRSVDNSPTTETIDTGYALYKQKYPMITEDDYNYFVELKQSGKPFYTDKNGFPHLPK